MCIIISVACFANAYVFQTKNELETAARPLNLSSQKMVGFCCCRNFQRKVSQRSSTKQFTTLITNFRKQGVLLMT